MVRIIKKSLLAAALLFLGFAANSFAEEITLVLSGQTHAMLYPCDCPIEPDGGIARRATLISALRKENPNLLLIDSGSFFAGGVMDQQSQTEELDKSRSRVDLKAMELMGYDAVLLSPDEFNFGGQFLNSSIAKSKIVFLGANIASGTTAPYLVKVFGQVKVGVIGLVSPFAATKAPELALVEPKEALKKALSELDKQNVELIILVSGLEEEKNQELLKGNPRITILIEGAKFAKEKVSTRFGSVLALAPRWEGRRLVTLNLSIKSKESLEIKEPQELRVSDKLSDSKDILAFLPQCYSEKNCKKEGMVSGCLNPGKPEAACQYKEAPEVGLTVINKPDCRTCNPEGVIASLKKEFPGLKVKYLNFPGKDAGKIIGELGLNYLPAYLLDKKNVNKESLPDKLKQDLEPKGEYYWVNINFSGIGYFLHRQNIADRLDVFLSLFNKDTGQILSNIKEFTPEIHFLATESKDGFSAESGAAEVEEDLRAVCVQKYYPGFFYSYLRCRTADYQSSWWDNCLRDVDPTLVKSCAQTQEGKDLLRENISLNRQLNITNGPTYLMDNEEVFSSVKVPEKEEFRKILLKR